MTVWERHALRLRRLEKISRRQAEFQRIDDWLLAHPRESTAIAVLLALLVLTLAELLRYGIDELARRLL